MKSTATLVNGFKSTVDNGRNHGIVIDLPESQGGTDVGATALELVVMALSGCISTIFTMIAKKSKLEFSGINVDVEADKPQGAATITSAKATVVVKSTAPAEKVQRILDKTMCVCPVGVLIEKAGIEIGVDLTVEPA